MSKVIAIINQKGGTGKTTTCLNLGVGLAKKGYKVLLIDNDPQSSLTVALGIANSDVLTETLADYYIQEIDSDSDEMHFNIKTYSEKDIEILDFIPSNISLSGVELSLFNAMNRERILKSFLSKNTKEGLSLLEKYDYILIDCSPSLSMLTINALSVANELVIPVQAQYLSANGLEQLLKTISKIKKQLNPKLNILGILFTMANQRTNEFKEMTSLIQEAYGSKINIFKTILPFSVKAAESTSRDGSSVVQTKYRTSFRYRNRGR